MIRTIAKDSIRLFTTTLRLLAVRLTLVSLIIKALIREMIGKENPIIAIASRITKKTIADRIAIIGNHGIRTMTTVRGQSVSVAVNSIALMSLKL